MANIYEVYGNYTLMCPHCFHYLTKHLTFTIHHTFSRAKNPVIDNFIAHYNTGVRVDDIHGTCPKCHEHVYWIEVDPGIVRIISQLNKKGYKTRWCCSSHDDDHNAPYIAFMEDLPTDVIKSLPKLWFYEPRSDCGAFPCIRAHDPKQRYGVSTLEQREALFNLYDWVKKLPAK